MPLKHIGISGHKKVFITPYAEWRFSLRNLSVKEALQGINNREVSYPKDEDGRQKIRSTVGTKKIFLTILEDSEKIVVITGGEA